MYMYIGICIGENPNILKIILVNDGISDLFTEHKKQCMHNFSSMPPSWSRLGMPIWTVASAFYVHKSAISELNGHEVLQHGPFLLPE